MRKKLQVVVWPLVALAAILVGAVLVPGLRSGEAAKSVVARILPRAQAAVERSRLQGGGAASSVPNRTVIQPGELKPASEEA